jgi:hypothetical protein
MNRELYLIINAKKILTCLLNSDQIIFFLMQKKERVGATNKDLDIKKKLYNYE